MLWVATRSVGWETTNTERGERVYLGLYHIAVDIPGFDDIQQADTGQDILQGWPGLRMVVGPEPGNLDIPDNGNIDS